MAKRVNRANKHASNGGISNEVWSIIADDDDDVDTDSDGDVDGNSCNNYRACLCIREIEILP